MDIKVHVRACMLNHISCVWLCKPMDYSSPGSSVHGIFQARMLERVAISSSRGSSQFSDQNYVSCTSCIDGRILYLLHHLDVEPSVMSDALQSHGLQHARPPCPSPSPRVCPSSCSLHRWSHLAISSSDSLFSFSPQSFSASGTISMSRLLASDDQNTGVSASASVLPVSIQGLSPLRLTGLISLLSKGLSGVFSSTTVWRHQFFGILPPLWSSSHNRMWPLGRP